MTDIPPAVLLKLWVRRSGDGQTFSLPARGFNAPARLSNTRFATTLRGNRALDILTPTMARTETDQAENRRTQYAALSAHHTALETIRFTIAGLYVAGAGS